MLHFQQQSFEFIASIFCWALLISILLKLYEIQKEINQPLKNVYQTYNLHLEQMNYRLEKIFNKAHNFEKWKTNVIVEHERLRRPGFAAAIRSCDLTLKDAFYNIFKKFLI